MLAGIFVIGVFGAVKLLDEPENQVSVMGVGKISYEADEARVTLGIQIDRAESAEAALTQLTERAKKIAAALAALGIAESDIHTSNYSVYAHYEYKSDGTSFISGYDANQQMQITVSGILEDKDRIGTVIAEATKVGSNQVQGITFTVSQLEELKQQARERALEDAQRKAEETSRKLGVTLGDIVSWSDNVIGAPGPQPYYYDQYGGGGGGAPIASGAQEIVVEAWIHFEVEN